MRRFALGSASGVGGVSVSLAWLGADPFKTTLSTFVIMKGLMESTINAVGFENLSGETVLAEMEALGSISDGVLVHLSKRLCIA